MNAQDIAEALRADECVLLLGPRAATFEGECLQDLLADRFAQRLGLPEGAPRDLPQLARQFSASCKNATEGLEKTGVLIREFYEEFRDEKIPLYDLAAELPFKYVLNCTPDNLFLKALERQDKEGLFFNFHFNKPIHNKNENDRALDVEKEVSEDKPLVYNLLGYYSDPSSLVLTDADRIRFLDVVLQQEKEATLPANIKYHYLRPPLNRLRKTYVFAGFDFNEWHLRLLVHLLRRNHEHLPHNLTLQGRESLQGDTAVFYSDNFDMLFVPDEPLALLEEVKNCLLIPAPIAPPARMELFLLYHPEDEALRAELETYLATLRHSGLIEVWHEARILGGSIPEEEMQQHLEQARIILPIVTANFLADDRLYSRYLDKALQRHRAGTAKVIPLLFSPCDVINTPLFELNTLYPKPKGRAVSQKPDRAATLTAFAQELRSIVERQLNLQTSAP
jgi:hypothetical protein